MRFSSPASLRRRRAEDEPPALDLLKRCADMLDELAVASRAKGVLEGDLETVIDDSVDLVFCDPPYAKKFVPLFGDLAQFAARTLIDADDTARGVFFGPVRWCIQAATSADCEPARGALVGCCRRVGIF